MQEIIHARKTGRPRDGRLFPEEDYRDHESLRSRRVKRNVDEIVTRSGVSLQVGFYKEVRIFTEV